MANENILTLKGVKVKHKLLGLNDTVTDALQGELFLTEVPGTGTRDPHTGDLIEPAYVARIGTGNLAVNSKTGEPILNADGEQISELSWLHAPASDVHEWAKFDSFDTAYANTSNVLKGEIDEIKATLGMEEPGDPDDPTAPPTTGLSAKLNNLLSTLVATPGADNTNPYIASIAAATGDDANTGKVTVTFGNLDNDLGNKLDSSAFTTFVGFTADDAPEEGAENAYSKYGASYKELAEDVYTFLHAEENVADVIDTLKEINDYISSNVEAFTELSGKVGDLETVVTGTDGLSDQVEALNQYKTNTLDPFFADPAGSEPEADSKAGIVAAIAANAGEITTLKGGVAMFSHDNGNVTIGSIAGASCTTLIIDCND